jgi:hypothetical protein
MHKKAHAMNHTTRTNRRHRLDQQRHTIAVCVAATTLTATLNGWTPTSSAAWTIAIIAIAIGLPHGALDIVIGPQLTKPTLFFAIYLTAALGIILVWLAAPAIGMAALFTSSWYHFARGDADHHRGPHSRPRRATNPPIHRHHRDSPPSPRIVVTQIPEFYRVARAPVSGRPDQPALTVDTAWRQPASQNRGRPR